MAEAGDVPRRLPRENEAESQQIHLECGKCVSKPLKARENEEKPMRSGLVPATEGLPEQIFVRAGVRGAGAWVCGAGRTGANGK